MQNEFNAEQSQWQVQGYMEAKPMDHYCSCIVVKLDEEGAEEAKAQGDLCLLEALTSVQGSYQLVTYNDESPIYRQEPMEGSGEQLFCFYMPQQGHQGWYMATSWPASKAEFDQLAEHLGVKAYPLGIDGHTVVQYGSAQKLHVPFWAKKAVVGVQVLPFNA